MQTVNDGIYRRYWKRPMDFLLSLSAFALLSPVLLVVALLVRIKLGSPVIFRQKRPGLNGKIFTLYKFKTMNDQRDQTGQLLPDEKRLSGLGQLLRSASLDELPQLFNILRGDMSVVGPRPLLIKDLVFMTAEQRQRHCVLPGLSGLAQVNGRNGILWEDKLRYDLQYLEQITFWSDWKIIWQTIINVCQGDSVCTEGMATGEDLGDYLLRLGRIDPATYRAGLAESRRINSSS